VDFHNWWAISCLACVCHFTFSVSTATVSNKTFVVIQISTESRTARGDEMLLHWESRKEAPCSRVEERTFQALLAQLVIEHVCNINKLTGLFLFISNHTRYLSLIFVTGSMYIIIVYSGNWHCLVTSVIHTVSQL